MRNSTESLYENERFYGLAWRLPALLERPHFSTEAGESVAIAAPPTEATGDWRLDVTDDTDADGWLYASVFKHLDYSRPGGRAGRRASDFVRRRRWFREASAPALGDSSEQTAAGRVCAAASHLSEAAKGVAEKLISPVASMHGDKVRKQTEADRRKGAVKVVLGMLASTIRRRQLWSVTPVDPAAWYVLLSAHQAALLEQKAAALAAAPSAVQTFGQGGRASPAPEASRELVRSLVCAAVHSRAAYGHAMAAGHLGSLLNFALLHTLHRLHFDPVGGASGAANNDAVAALAGIPPPDLRLAEWHNSVSRPCHYLAVDRAHQRIVLAIRGSLEAGDAFSDLTAQPLEIFGMLDTEGLIHEGMMSAATYVQCNTAPALASLAKSHPGWPLLITGHSMGGSVATILALLMRAGEAPPGLGLVTCVAIGPPPVLSRPLAEACDAFVTTVVLGADVVPRVSYASVEDVFLEFANSSPIGTLGRKVTATLGGLKTHWPAVLNPTAVQAPAMPTLGGLRNLVSLAESEAATANAARTAGSAAAALEQEADPSEGGAQVEMPSRIHRNDVSSDVGSKPQPSPAGGGSGGAYSFPGRLSRADATSAARRLSAYRDQADSRAQPAEAGRLEERQGAGAAAGDERVGHGRSARADHETAAEVLGTGGSELRDASGNPEPLFLAGRVLWLIPARAGQQAAGQAVQPHEIEMTGRESSAEPAPDLERRTADPENRAALRQSPIEEATSARMDVENAAGQASGEVSDGERSQKRPASPLADDRTAASSLKSEFPSLAVYEDSPSGPSPLCEEGAIHSAPPSPPVEQAQKRLRPDDGLDSVLAGLESAAAAASSAGGGESHGDDSGGPRLLVVDRGVFARILLTMDMVQDHLPDAYVGAVNQL